MNRKYVSMWLYLIALTGVELVLAYRHVFSSGLMMLVLMILSILKAGMIMTWFMHLGNEKLGFILTLIPPLVLTVSLLFGFFPDAYRLWELSVH